MTETSQSRLIKLKEAIQSADLRVLLMVLVHFTGDQKWLADRYAPARDVRLIPEPDAGIPSDVQEEIRSAAVHVISQGKPPAITDPGDELIHRMMSVCLGEDVPAEYAPLTREEMGLVSRCVKWEKPLVSAGDLRDFLIVGAGVCGIAIAANLKHLGVPFTILDKRDDVGGTWLANRYPGCGVDTPNHSYSYSFGPRYRWPRYFSRREEVQKYLAGVVDSLELRQHIRFNTELTGSRWDDDRKSWISTVRTPQGVEKVESRFLVSAIGQLSDPSIPLIKGAESFKGASFHSSMWPDGLVVAGKRLAVIGTGATAMQLVPEIADVTNSISVYQRTAQWSRPIPGYSASIPDTAQWLLQEVPFYAEWFRFNMFWRYGDGLLKFLKIDPEWPHQERSVNRVNDRHRQEMLDFMLSELGDRTDLVNKCAPTYPPYGKRILLDNSWYRTLCKPNVELIVDAIGRIVPEGVETVDGQIRPADVIVYSTGFKVTEMAGRLGIVGRDGIDLRKAWDGDNPSAFLGLTVPGFPNFFCMLGPGSGPGHGGSAVFQAECQSRYITSCLVKLESRGADALEVRPDVLDAYMKKFDAEHESLIWSHPGMSTYYRNSRGRVFSVMPWRFVDYWEMTHDARLDDYIVTRSRHARAAMEAT